MRRSGYAQIIRDSPTLKRRAKQREPTKGSQDTRYFMRQLVLLQNCLIGFASEQPVIVLFNLLGESFQFHLEPICRPLVNRSDIGWMVE